MCRHEAGHLLGALEVIHGDFSAELAQVLRRGQAVGFYRQHRQAGFQRWAAHLDHALVGQETVGEQNARQLGAVHGGQRGGQHHIVTVAGGHDQAARGEDMQRIGRTSGAQAGR